MRTKTAFPFEADEVVYCRETHAATGPEGDYVVHAGERLRSSNAKVHLHPEWFQRDGEEFVPWEPPKAEDKPQRASKPVKMYRAKRAYGSDTALPLGAGLSALGYAAVEEGEIIPETHPLLKLPKAKRDQIFELVKS